MLKTNNILQNTVSQIEGCIVSDMDGEKVMLNVEKGKYFNLGKIGGQIWELMKEEIPVNKLIKKLLLIYDVEQTKCEEDVVSFLEHLLNEGLIKLIEK